MIRNLPVRSSDEPLTKEYLDGQLTGMRAELTGLRAEQRADLRVEINRALFWIIGSIVATGAAAVLTLAAID